MRQDKGRDVPAGPEGAVGKTTSKERTYSGGKIEKLSQTRNKHLQSSGNQKGNVRSSGGEQCLLQSKKLHQEEEPGRAEKEGGILS